MPCNPKNMTLVYTAPGDGRKIFVGDSNAANDTNQLIACGVTGVLNVAYDCDDHPDFPRVRLAEDPYRPGPQASDPGQNPISSFSFEVQFAKVGLIDGTGNPAGCMGFAAAVYMADQLWRFPSQQDTCPPLVNVYRTGGNLLIHCCSGGSRSVTVAALFIWYRWGATGLDPRLGGFQETYNGVKQARGDSLKPWETGDGPCIPPRPFPWLARGEYTKVPPQVGTQEAALQLTLTYSQLFPLPKRRLLSWAVSSRRAGGRHRDRLR